MAAATAVATAPKPVAAATLAKSAGSGAVSAFGVPVLTEDPKRHRRFKFPQLEGLMVSAFARLTARWRATKATWATDGINSKT